MVNNTPSEFRGPEGCDSLMADRFRPTAAAGNRHGRYAIWAPSADTVFAMAVNNG